MENDPHKASSQGASPLLDAAAEKAAAEKAAAEKAAAEKAAAEKAAAEKAAAEKAAAEKAAGARPAPPRGRTRSTKRKGGDGREQLVLRTSRILNPATGRSIARGRIVDVPVGRAEAMVADGLARPATPAEVKAAAHPVIRLD